MQFKSHIPLNWLPGAVIWVAASGFGTVDVQQIKQFAVAQPQMDNPLLGADITASTNLHVTLPRFNDALPHHVKAATDYQLKILKAKFNRLLHDIDSGEAQSYSSIVEELEKMKDPLDSTLAIVEHLLMVNQSDELKFAHNMSMTSIIQLQQGMAQSDAVLVALQALVSPAYSGTPLTSVQRHIVNIHIRDMRRNGVGLDSADKLKFNELQMNISHLQAQFNNNVLKSSEGFTLTLKKKSSVEGMPGALTRQLAQNAVQKGHLGATAGDGPWVVTLDIYAACIKHLKSRRMREGEVRCGDLPPCIMHVILELQHARVLVVQIYCSDCRC
jgi:oligopeptidase A